MIRAVLVFVGVPLSLCAIGILTVVLRSRRLRNRLGTLPSPGTELSAGSNPP
jgi:hypothetical protein